MTFLPKGYVAPEPHSNYLKFQEGDTRFRFLTDPIMGWVYWVEGDDKKAPHRVRTAEEIPAAYKNSKDTKFFWAAVVLDYRTGALKILEITQRTIQGPIEDLCANEDWGSPLEYDLTVKKTGESLKTEYNVMPSPKKPVDPSLTKQAKEIDLEVLYEGGDPFANL